MSTRKTGKGGTRSGGRKRHSPTTRKPATIDMEPNAVTSKPSDAAKAADDKASDKSETIAPATAGKAETTRHLTMAIALLNEVTPAHVN